MKKAVFDSQQNFIKVNFSGYPTLPEFQAVANSILDVLQSSGSGKVLNDTTDLAVNSIEVQEWTQREWFPKATELGLKKFAFLVSKNIFGEVSAQQTNEKAEEEGAVNIKYFKAEEEAVSWLQA